MNVLFICKYNLFRSRVAEAYLNSRKNPLFTAKSAGLIPGFPMLESILSAAEKCGITLSGTTKGVTRELLVWADTIIIVADNVDKKFFTADGILAHRELIKWNIPDTGADAFHARIRVTKTICEKVDEFVKQYDV